MYVPTEGEIEKESLDESLAAHPLLREKGCVACEAQRDAGVSVCVRLSTCVCVCVCVCGGVCCCCDERCAYEITAMRVCVCVCVCVRVCIKVCEGFLGCVNSPVLSQVIYFLN